MLTPESIKAVRLYITLKGLMFLSKKIKIAILKIIFINIFLVDDFSNDIKSENS